MKKITSILILIGVFACSSYVFAHDNGMKKPIGIDNINYSLQSNVATVSIFNYDVVEAAGSIAFTPYLLKVNENLNFETALKSFDKDVSHILMLNISNDSKYLKSNISYAIITDRLCIKIMRKRYPIISATPLPKHYLLPEKNITWQFGSNQRNC